ncbi:MAG: peptidoglycan bridge formation glycyltransferase FemA/FemB family protein [Anaerolineae bacterium]
MTTVEHVTDRETWDRLLLTWPRPHVLQSWLWGQCKAQTGWRAHRLLIREGDRVLGAAAMLVRGLFHTPARIAYIPKGPTLDWEDDQAVVAVLKAIEREARRTRAWFVKIDPDVRLDSPTGQRVVQALRELGWRPSAEQIQFRNTVLIDLEPEEDALLAAMKPKWRYNIRLAGRRGVQIRAGSLDDLATFYELYEETSRRDQFLIRPFEYYEVIWRSFLERGLGHLLLAEAGERPIAGLFLFRFGPTAWYFYGASSSAHRNLMPNHLLQWEAMRWARSQGCHLYDLWGAPDQPDESDPMWGVYRFKEGFGGQFTRWIGAWDLPISRGGYWLYNVLMPRVLELMRRRHSQ